MLVELIGPGGVGKTTVEPLIASNLGIAFYPAKRRHGFEGEPLTKWQVQYARLASVLRNPNLFARALLAIDRPLRSRLRFALDTTRRDRIASRAARRGSGVLASGPLHGLCEAAARYRCDVTALVRHVKHADVYIVLSADIEVTTGRLRQRREISDEDATTHYRNYTEAAARGLELTGRPIFEIDATPSPDAIAAEAARSLDAMKIEEAG